mgnify:CR=1 FL=1
MKEGKIAYVIIFEVVCLITLKKGRSFAFTAQERPMPKIVRNEKWHTGSI